MTDTECKSHEGSFSVSGKLHREFIVTINYDFSSAHGALLLMERLQKGEKVSFLPWRSLFKTSGYSALLENHMGSKAGFKEYLVNGATGDLQDSSLLQGNLTELIKNVEEINTELVALFEKWFPQEFTIEQTRLFFVPHGDEDREPSVVDLSYALSLNRSELAKVMLQKILILLIRPYQNLEKAYLKHFLPIRKYMNFIYGLWDVQTAGLAALIEEDEGEKAQPEGKDNNYLSLMNTLFTEAARAVSESDKKKIEQVGSRFRKEIPAKEGGRLIYRLLYEKTSLDGLHDSLVHPGKPCQILGKADSTLFSPEALFFLEQIETLLS
jgi:hypothetical protein